MYRILLLSLTVIIAAHCTAPPSGAVESGQARATRDVDEWTTDIEEARQGVGQFRARVYRELPTVLDEETHNVQTALEAFGQEPNAQNRINLQETTLGALLRVNDLAKSVLEQREEIRSQLAAIEEKAFGRAGEYRVEGERIDEALPDKRAELETLKAGNQVKKREYADGPRSREEERELREAYLAEQRLARTIRFDEARVRQTAAAGQMFRQKAKEIQWLRDRVEDTFISLEFCQQTCRDSAKLLKEQIELERQLAALGGASEWADYADKIRLLDEAVHAGTDAILAVDPDQSVGASTTLQSDFQRWLDEF
jgi:hypothetical protein